MSTDEVRLLKLGDYLKYSTGNKSDEYFMVTEIQDVFKLRRVGNQELIIIENPEELEAYSKVNTNRD